eukprot:4575433-Amphidinium_carterae.1
MGAFVHGCCFSMCISANSCVHMRVALILRIHVTTLHGPAEVNHGAGTRLSRLPPWRRANRTFGCLPLIKELWRERALFFNTVALAKLDMSLQNHGHAPPFGLCGFVYTLQDTLQGVYISLSALIGRQ